MAALERPIRVVFFGGPWLQAGARRFVAMLEEHPDIDLVRGYCEGHGRSPFVETWRRRGLAAVPLRLAAVAGECREFLRGPPAWRRRRLAARALRKFRTVPALHAPAVVQELRALVPDLGVIYGGPILRPELFSIPALGTLGIHHGRAPDYRGKKTTFWEMYHGETQAGITIQRIGAGLDTGDIVRRGAVEIGAKSYGRVWREVEEEGCRLFLDAILDLKAARAEFTPQAAAAGTLYRQPPAGLLLRLWLRRLLRLPPPRAAR